MKIKKHLLHVGLTKVSMMKRESSFRIRKEPTTMTIARCMDIVWSIVGKFMGILQIIYLTHGKKKDPRRLVKLKDIHGMKELLVSQN